MVSSVEFLTTFFRLGANEKLAVIQDVRRRNEKIAAKRKRLAEEKVQRALENVKTRIEWPVLPVLEGDSPAKQTVERHTNRRYREVKKKSISEILDTGKLKTPVKGDTGSIAEKFTKASPSTRDFIKEIEAREREITR